MTGWPPTGGLTAITGLEKGSGKTTLFSALLPRMRRAGPIGLFSVGVDGGLKHREGERSAEVHVEPGDVVLTTDRFSRVSAARLEILDVPGERSSLGRLVLGRVQRAGEVTLVGPENLAGLSEIIDRVRDEGWATSCLVDGAASRITQVSALAGAGFFFTVKVDRSNLSRVASKLQSLVSLCGLSVAREPSSGVLRLEGPLTPEVLSSLPAGVTDLSIEDFTKFFLPPAALRRLLEKTKVSLRRGFRLLGILAVTRELTRRDLETACGPAVAETLIENPCEVAFG